MTVHDEIVAVVDEDKGTCRVELIDFGAAAGTKEAA